VLAARIGEHKQGRDVFNQRKIAGTKGSVQMQVQGLDSLTAKGYG
jgi:hypothetical protein